MDSPNEEVGLLIADSAATSQSANNSIMNMIRKVQDTVHACIPSIRSATSSSIMHSSLTSSVSFGNGESRGG